MLKIISAIVVENVCGPDFISLETNLPSPTPGITSENLSLDFRAAAGSGEKYIKQNFPEIKKVKIIKVEKNPYKFSGRD